MVAYLGKADLFPLLAAFPEAVRDVKDVAREATDLRLVSGVKNFERILSLRRLRRLWCFKLNEKSLAVLIHCTSLERLYVDGLRYENLDALTRLRGLIVLSVDSATRVISLRGLEQLASLRGLSIVHFPMVHSLSPLGDMRQLEALAIAGSTWTRMTVDTLSPIAGLRALRYLNLTNLKARDESLEPLSDLQSLEALDLPNFYPVAQFARLAAKLKNTRCAWFEPVTALRSVKCRKCNNETVVMLTGKGKPLLCSRCDELRVKEHEESFRSLIANAR